MKVLALAAALALLSAPPANAASLFDPALRFRMLATDHFVIYFDDDEAPLAPRLAAIAEAAWKQVPPMLGVPAPSQTHVVLADQSDAANGWAYPLPYNTIVVTAAWPRGTDFIGNTDDWLELVFVHEFTHIVQLDHARGWSRLARTIFGRAPFAFPNLFLPTWQVEGLATMVESLTRAGGGRLMSQHFRELEFGPARRGERQPLDRVNGGLTAWPGGQAPYAYGLGFYDFLAGYYGDMERVASLVSRTAGRLPYTSSRVFEEVFGQSLGELWTAYQEHLAFRVRLLTELAADRFPKMPAPATRITQHGYYTSGPRYVPGQCDECPPRIVYTMRTPHEFPALHIVDADGANHQTVATRFLGETIGGRGSMIVFDQQERHRNVGVYSDLYTVALPTGEVRRLTNEARLRDPDVSPDGTQVVAVRERGGSRELVLLSLATREVSVLLKGTELQFDSPRWSPDGRLIVATRRTLHSARARNSIPAAELVIVDAASRRIHSIITDFNAGQAAWRPDGTGLIVSASEGDNFQLYDMVAPLATFAPGAEQVMPRWQALTTGPGGALWPDVAPDGRSIAFISRSDTGFDVFTIPYSPSSESFEPFATGSVVPDATAEVQAPAPSSAVAAPRYRPWRTLVPRAWSPVLEDAGGGVRIGAATGGSDVLGYHTYAGSVAWLVSRPSDAVDPSSGTPDWFAAYSYARWRPTFFASASRTTSFFRAFPFDAAADPVTETWQDRDVEAGVVIPFERVRISHRGLATVLYSRSDVNSSLGTRILERTATRTGWSTVSARTYGYSISREDGAAIGSTAEWAFGDRETATTITGDARVYLPGVGQHHVVALRAGGGVSQGPRDLRRTFYLGGAAAAGDALDFSRNAFSLLRGFPSESFGGSRVALINAEYRWPLARPERGVGTWPAFLHSIHASVFGDLGHAWTETLRAGDAKLALGGELSFDVIVGYSLPLTITSGVAWGRDGARPASHPAAHNTAAFLRVGAGF